MVRAAEARPSVRHTVYLECGPLSGVHVVTAPELPERVTLDLLGHRVTFQRDSSRRQFVVNGHAPVFVCVNIREAISI